MDEIARNLIKSIQRRATDLKNPFSGEYMDAEEMQPAPTNARDFQRWIVERQMEMRTAVQESVERAVWLASDAEKLVQVWAVAGRASGMTWREVADLLGVTPQAAQQRYRGL